MKTQKLKNSEELKSINLIFLLIAIFIIEVMVLTSGSRESTKPYFERMEQNFMPKIDPIIFSQPIALKLESENLYQNIKLREKATIREIERNNAMNFDKEFSMAKLKTYLIKEADPALSINDVQSIQFPEYKATPINSSFYFKNDKQLLELKAAAYEKTLASLQIYTFEKKLQEYLVVEKEKPLELEKWMTDEKCWCPELRETMNFAELK